MQLQYPGWQRAGGTHIRGCPWLDGVRLDAARLDDLWKGLGWRDAVALVQACAGHFAAVRDDGAGLLLVCDGIRSIPLFYATRNDERRVSDNPRLLTEDIDDLDDLSIAEFLMAGQVSNRYTLLPDVGQVQAGEAVMLSADSGEIDRYRYFLFRFLVKLL